MKITQTLLTEIYKPVHHISPTIMKNLFDLSVNQYNLHSNCLLKITANITGRNGT